MELTGPVKRWKSYGKPQRTEIFIRWSFYLAALTQPLVVLGALAGPSAHRSSAPPVIAVTLATTTLAIIGSRTALAHYLGRRPRPTALLVGSAVVMLGSHWAALLWAGPVSDATVPPIVSATVWQLVFWFAQVAIILPIRTAVLVGAAVQLVSLPAALLGGIPTSTAAGLVIGSTFSMVLFGATCRGTAWIASVVWELDAAQETRARLAVAEERLRFSRDLHDVLGRNLTTIALKSELAVRLARRGRPESADQMVEVQRIAQESQREVREVVRGYRTADLQAEVHGARAVLRAAGVVCEVDLGSDTAALPPVAQSVLGWVVREATTNVLRHSEARHCTVRLLLTGGQALLEVENDGVPEPREPAHRPGTGLLGLAERLTAHGGTLDLPPAAPGRFLVAAALPLAVPALEVVAP